MSHAPAPHAARLRGTAAGLLTATLALAAHGVGGGAMPAGAVAVQLLVVAVTVGVLAAAVRRAADAPVMLGLLAAGQLVAHLIAAAGHSHHPGPAPWSMALAHLVAIGSGAVLISVGDRLCGAMSRVLRAAARHVGPPIATPYLPKATCADQPLRWRLLLAASMSHRGPPVSTVR